ncbi:MAG: SAM-dependent DNA methyltransferase, partial [Gammaproteobacteria bacterium]|nr:SAM-dependent DNA methyltransferase [Gammaproteobacteria bacterium]
MTNGDLNWIANYIWGIADDVLRDLYQRGKYRDVILPMTVLRRLDAVLESGKTAVLDMKERLDEAGVVEQDAMLRQAAGQAFYNTSRFTLGDLRARANRDRLEADFRDYLDGFSPNVQDILNCFEFRNQIPKLSRADALGSLIEKVTSPEINLGPEAVRNADGTVRR